MFIKNNSKGHIESIILKKKELIFPWGIECGDSMGFFSQTDSGVRSSNEYLKIKITNSSSSSIQKVNLSDGELIVGSNNQWNKKEIERNVYAKAVKDTFLMDFVLRYRFKKNIFHTAIINKKKIIHNKTNIYYQYPVKEAMLLGEDCKITIKLNEVETADIFKPYMYVRDFEDEWIIHCRLLPEVFEKKVLKLNVPWYNKSIPQFLSNIILSIPILQKRTWYRTEKKKYSSWNLIGRFFKPSSYPLAMLKAGKIISINSTFFIETLK